MIKIDFLFSRKIWMPGWGEISLSALLIAVVSGILLLPFVPAAGDTFTNISQLISMRAGHFLHSLHSYAADLFLISLFMHTFEYLYKKAYLSYSLKSWGWLALLTILSVLIVLSGFLSMGSKEGLSAIAILKGILNTVLLLGKPLREFLFGLQPLQAIYAHHVSTFSILILILIYIHLRRSRPETYALVYTLIILFIVSGLRPAFIGHAPDTLLEVVKGPWYFIGLQEMLAWMPVWLPGLLLPLVGILIFAVLPHSKSWASKIIGFMIVLLLFYFVEMVIGLYFRGDAWQFLMR